jgi:hypothetical protein
MAISDNSVALKTVRQRNYLARDFDGFRTVLLDYARQYYPEQIQDFSESSLGGLLLDMAAYVGDNMSYYMDHLYGELNSETVVETANIERILRSAGVPIHGAAAAVVDADFYIEVPVLSDGTLTPDSTLLPTVNEGSIIQSSTGISFNLLENIDFWKSDPISGQISIADDVEVTNGRRLSGNIVSKILKKKGTCGSGNQTTETFSVGDFVQFRRLTLSQSDVTQIISVSDSLGNVYYEVGNLTHDVVYKNVLNTVEKDVLVKDILKVIPAPYRFVKETSLSNRTSTLLFGGGNADVIEDDIIPDPSEFSIPLPYSQTFSKIPINPQKMLQGTTLGVAGANTTLTVTYRYGGGLNHNAKPGTIRSVSTLSMTFPQNPSAGQQSQIRNTLAVTNPFDASGGEDPLTTDELMALVPTIKNSQERIVTKEDLLARVYTMPSNFGRVFRVAITKNPNNPLASRLFIVSRNIDGQLITSSDKLKLNLKRYLNSYRMISDAIDIQDAGIINLELFFQVVVDPSMNKSVLIQSVIRDLKAQFEITKLHIGQPIIMSDIISTIFAHQGIISVDTVKFNNLNGTNNNLQYSPIAYNPQFNTKNNIMYPLEGSIFEIRYPDVNIVGKAMSNV